MALEIIKEILSIAINAPSGSNSQPWRFEVRDDEICVIAEPENDHSILNYRNRGTWIAHGALIENIKIAAAALGYQSNITIFPDPTHPNLTAKIKLTEGPPADEGLWEVMPQRATNRKRYGLQPLTSEQKKYLDQSVDDIGGQVKLVWIEDRGQINRLGQAAAANEIVTLENQKLHRLFFNEIVWNPQEEQKKMKGLFIKTMELRPPEQAALKLFKHWPVMRNLSQLGIARKIAAGNAKNYAATPMMGLVVVPDEDREFIAAGRVIERIWLRATRLCFGCHLITGTMFFWQGINLGGLKLFSDKHQRIINEEYQALTDIADVKGKNELVTALLRIGPAVAPSARSSKKEPVVEFNQ